MISVSYEIQGWFGAEGGCARGSMQTSGLRDLGFRVSEPVAMDTEEQLQLPPEPNMGRTWEKEKQNRNDICHGKVGQDC